MGSASSIALSGLQAATSHLGVAAHNIANVQTPGMRRQAVSQASQPEGGVSATVHQLPEPGESLETDVVNQMMASYVYKANLKTIETERAMTGALLDIRA